MINKTLSLIYSIELNSPVIANASVVFISFL